MPNKKVKRVGRVYIELGYTVDMDNEEMVKKAREMLLEDLMAMFRDGKEEVDVNIREEDDFIGAFDESDIPECLMPEKEDEEDEEEQTRRDEKNGLYGGKIDVAN